MMSGSATMSSTRMRGSSEPNGSWKMICMSRRSWRSSPREAASTSRPSKETEPEVGSMRRRMRRPSVLLPEPDSPTRPKVSPGAMASETPSTARTSPWARAPKAFAPSGKTLVRSRTSTSGTLLVFLRRLGVGRGRRRRRRHFLLEAVAELLPARWILLQQVIEPGDAVLERWMRVPVPQAGVLGVRRIGGIDGEALEEILEPGRIVAGRGRELCALGVGFVLLVGTVVLGQRGRDQVVGKVLQHVGRNVRRAFLDRETGELLVADDGLEVASVDVRDFMREHAGEFGLVLHLLDRA